jgi:ribosomal-protein-alanine N-acetyltransferase
LPTGLGLRPRKNPKLSVSSGLLVSPTAQCTSSGGLNTLRERSSGALVGYCGLLVQQEEVTELEIGYSLLPSYWGQGYASEAALICKAFATTHQLASSIISIISLPNVASQHVARNVGMQGEKVTWYAGNEVKIFRVALG